MNTAFPYDTPHLLPYVIFYLSPFRSVPQTLRYLLPFSFQICATNLTLSSTFLLSDRCHKPYVIFYLSPFRSVPQTLRYLLPFSFQICATNLTLSSTFLLSDRCHKPYVIFYLSPFRSVPQTLRYLLPFSFQICATNLTLSYTFILSDLCHEAELSRWLATTILKIEIIIFYETNTHNKNYRNMNWHQLVTHFKSLGLVVASTTMCLACSKYIYL